MSIVSIIGAETISRIGVDLCGADGEVWGINNIYKGAALNWTRWFEIHAVDYLRRKQKHWAWLREQKKPIYMQAKIDEVPASVAFPRAELDAFLLDKFGSEPGYYTSTASYALGLAMMEGFTEIRLYGWNCADLYEISFERAGLEYFVGLARGSGVRVVISPDSPLLHIGYTYAYVEPRFDRQEFGAVLRRYVDDRLIIMQQDRLRTAEVMSSPSREWSEWRERVLEYDAVYLPLLLLPPQPTVRQLLSARLWLSTYARRPGNILLPDGSLSP